MNQKKDLFDRSKTHANVGTIGHVNHGETSLVDAIKTVLGKRGECVSCEGRFLYNEQIYRDFNNQTYCETCYKEKYDDFS